MDLIFIFVAAYCLHFISASFYGRSSIYIVDRCRTKEIQERQISHSLKTCQGLFLNVLSDSPSKLMDSTELVAALRKLETAQGNILNIPVSSIRPILKECAKQIEKRLFAEYLITLYITDSVTFRLLQEIFNITTFDSIACQLARNNSLPKLQSCSCLPSVDLIDLILKKGEYMLLPNELLNSLRIIYMERIIRLYMLSNDCNLPLAFQAKAAKIIVNNINIALPFIKEAYKQCNNISESGKRILLAGLCPGGKLGVLNGLGAELECGHLFDLTVEEFAELSLSVPQNIRKALHDKWCLLQNYRAKQQLAMRAETNYFIT